MVQNSLTQIVEKHVVDYQIPDYLCLQMISGGILTYATPDPYSTECIAYYQNGTSAGHGQCTVVVMYSTAWGQSLTSDGHSNVIAPTYRYKATFGTYGVAMGINYASPESDAKFVVPVNTLSGTSVSSVTSQMTLSLFWTSSFVRISGTINGNSARFPVDNIYFQFLRTVERT